MNNNKLMYFSIGIVFVIFTICQIFYFAQVELLPFGEMTFEAISKTIIYILEGALLVALSIAMFYLLPLICVVKFSTLFIGFKGVNITIKGTDDSVKLVPTFYTKKLYQTIQVIRC